MTKSNSSRSGGSNRSGATPNNSAIPSNVPKSAITGGNTSGNSGKKQTSGGTSSSTMTTTGVIPTNVPKKNITISSTSKTPNTTSGTSGSNMTKSNSSRSGGSNRSGATPNNSAIPSNVPKSAITGGNTSSNSEKKQPSGGTSSSNMTTTGVIPTNVPKKNITISSTSKTPNTTSGTSGSNMTTTGVIPTNVPKKNITTPLSTGNIDESIRKLTDSKMPTFNAPSVNEIATQVINGRWGSGPDRQKRLEEAGYNYKDVQSEVNNIISGKSKPYTGTPTEISKITGLEKEKKSIVADAGQIGITNSFQPNYDKTIPEKSEKTSLQKNDSLITTGKISNIIDKDKFYQKIGEATYYTEWNNDAGMNKWAKDNWAKNDQEKWNEKGIKDGISKGMVPAEIINGSYYQGKTTSLSSMIKEACDYYGYDHPEDIMAQMLHESNGGEYEKLGPVGAAFGWDPDTDIEGGTGINNRNDPAQAVWGTVAQFAYWKNLYSNPGVISDEQARANAMAAYAAGGYSFFSKGFDATNSKGTNMTTMIFNDQPGSNAVYGTMVLSQAIAENDLAKLAENKDHAVTIKDYDITFGSNGKITYNQKPADTSTFLK